MSSTIDMQDIMYLNLFERTTRVTTRFCFKYNDTIFFCVPKDLVSKAIGPNGYNAKKLNEILNKKIKVIPAPKGIQDAKKFIQDIVNPVVFKDIDVRENEILLSASTQSKASLIGRNKRRLLEMQKIIKDFFGKEFRIV
jgi:NusA-like KH domain protein